MTDAASAGLRPWEAERLEPQEIERLVSAQDERFSRLAALVGWSTWMLWMQQLGKEERLKWGSFSDWLRYFRPPGFTPPPDEEGE